VTGSKDWQESGKKDAQEGINEMKVGPESSVFCQDLAHILMVANFELNRQRMRRRRQSQRQVESAGGLRNWRARRQDVRVWRRRG
jgi:hypothetical protein